MRRSIRWTLQIWYAAILALAVVGIGLASYFAIRQARFHEIDSELEAAGQVLVAKLRGPPHGPPPLWLNLFDGDPNHRPDDGRPDEGPPDGDPNDHYGPRPDRRSPPVFQLPPGFLQHYGGIDLDARSFEIFRPNRQVINAWGVKYDPANLPADDKATSGGKMVHRNVGAMHEMIFPGPGDLQVLVSGSVQRVEEELQQLLWALCIAASGVLVIGLTGGWLVLRWAMKPIGLMSETAGSISGTNLTGRIDTTRVPSELRKLATVLNGTFARLEAAFSQQARFTADASHELRTPLAVVLSHAELALSRDRSADEYRKAIQTCLSASTRMKTLVESLLLLSHADVGELALNRCPMDLSDVVRDCVNLLGTLASQRSITISAQLQNATLIGDPSRLGQVVVNLITNAIRYNREGGSVTISTAIDQQNAIFTVTDTGVGISAEDQPQVFVRFFRADKARSRDAGGSGLGLAITKSIVEAHDGTIHVQSEIGVGTQFTVRLPRGSAAEVNAIEASDHQVISAI